MKQDAGHLFFHKGWQDFVKDNSLEAGEFLVFRYDGNSGFDVQIFGKSGCEKGGSLFYKKARKCLRFTALCTCRFQIKSAESVEKNGEFVHLFSSILTLRSLYSNIVCITLHGTGWAGKGKRKAVFDVKSCRFKLKHPHFTARWRQHKPYTVVCFLSDIIGPLVMVFSCFFEGSVFNTRNAILMFLLVSVLPVLVEKINLDFSLQFVYSLYFLHKSGKICFFGGCFHVQVSSTTFQDRNIYNNP